LEVSKDEETNEKLMASLNGKPVLEIEQVAASTAAQFDIKQPVFYARFNWNAILKYTASDKVQFKEVPKFPMVERDLAMVVPRQMKYEEIRSTIDKLRLDKLQDVKLFDVFESEKLGAGKKSLAVNFIFQDEEKTLTDKEIDAWMNKIMTALEKESGAEIRKQ
ncbi:MAG: phenylalanine--tRNA ligase subunit beta, partial [Chitinophagaceae bacterium]|nr:phenylalanine--tRNA ligase subunit beta [Chitinophagaceae bacterium]